MKLSRLLLAILLCALYACAGTTPLPAPTPSAVVPSLASTPQSRATQTPPPSQTPLPSPAATTTLLPSSSPTAAPSATEFILPTDTPDARWKIPVVSVSLDPDGTAVWQDKLVIGDISQDGKEQFMSADSGQEVTATPTPALPTDLKETVLSPDGKYFIGTTKDSVGLYRTTNWLLLAQIAITSEAYSLWAPTSLVGATAIDNGLYFWYTDGRAPRQVLSGFAGLLTWSPDGTRLAALADSKDGLAPVILSANGKQPRWLQADISGFPAIGWISTDLVEVNASGAWFTLHQIFEANTGRKLPFWGDAFALSQGSAYSPDWRWQMTDDSERLWRGDPYASPDYFAHTYSVADLKTGQASILVDGASQYMDWLGWTEDSRTFYLISRPADTKALNNPDVPFGLLAFDPVTRKFTMLFEQAVHANLSPDQKSAWVVFPAKRADGTTGLDGGLFNPETKTFVGRRPMFDQVEYALRLTELLPAAWSHNGKWLATADGLGNVYLFDVNGNAHLIASNLPLGDWEYDHFSWLRFLWSPDDRHLLVQNQGEGWIVNIPR